MRMELDVGQPVVLPPGPGDKLLLDDLFVSDLDATMNVEPHVHREHVDSFYVLEGTFTFDRSGEEVELGPGDYAAFAGDVPHTYTALEPGTFAVLVMEHP